ncbi:MAG: hypothetical protein GF411_01895 [Candidatus Lokiarchaeota archaeon]|nr:hypothetical protein [Candidatus Lokiarchaeota archaeon]
MPEIPELEALVVKLNEVLSGKKIISAKVLNHIILHGNTASEFEQTVEGTVLQSFRADGKFLVISLDLPFEIVLHPMLAGRFRYLFEKRNAGKTDCIVFRLSEGTLWYNDRKQMSRVYLVDKGVYTDVAGFIGRGVSALDASLTAEIFQKRITNFHGPIKNVLRNQRFLKGIGNAYADEILLFAGILPFRKRSSLNIEELEKLHSAITSVLTRYKALLLKRSLNEVISEPRDFLMIHGKSDGICPLCGGRISEITADRFRTNYCQTCQK